MLYAYLKIVVIMAVPLVTVFYAKQIRIEGDMQLIKWEVEHPPTLQWTMNHPGESLAQNRADAKYLHHLIQDMDNN